MQGDPLKSSVYREESIEAITEALDSRICNENVQKEAAKALLILGGRYGYTGTPEVEKWILKEAGFDESLEGGFHGRYYVVRGSEHLVYISSQTKIQKFWVVNIYAHSSSMVRF